MKISGFKRIVKEDFDKEDQPLIEKLATVFNLFQEQVYYAFNNGITLTENVMAQTVTFRVQVNSVGEPTQNSQIKYTLKTRPLGHQVINIRSLDGSLLNGSPFLLYDINQDIITIKQITGLLSGKTYEITVVFYGS